MMKPVILAALAAGVAVVVKRRGASSKADAALWAEATAPRATAPRAATPKPDLAKPSAAEPTPAKPPAAEPADES